MNRRLVAAFAALAAGLFAACRHETAEHDATPADGETAEAKPYSVEHEKNGDATVILTPEALAAAGITTEKSIGVMAEDGIEAYGELVADPARVAVVRAPLAGTLQSPRAVDPKQSWPAIGAHVEAGTQFGLLVPRAVPLTTAEVADLASKLAVAQADEKSTQAELDAANAALTRAKSLNGLGKGVSDQVVEAATAAVASAKARLAAAHASAEIFETAAKPAGAVVLAPLPLYAPRSGEVVALSAQPSESVEAGAELVRIADFSELFADIRLPVSSTGAVAFTSARIRPNDNPGSGFEATIVGLAPESDPLAPRLRLRVRIPSSRLRPGLGVTAQLISTSESNPLHPVVRVPASALLRYASRNWVYVETEERHFTRRAVVVEHATGDQVLLTSGVEAGATIVTAGAMTLLSQEQLAAGGGEGE